MKTKLTIGQKRARARWDLLRRTTMRLTLEQAIAMAQRAADQERKLMAVWNLNRYVPLYVTRYARDGDAERDGVVAIVHPCEPSDDDLEAIS